MLKRTAVTTALLTSSLMALGCAGSQQPVRTQAELGRVVIYRNGVAYFERRAQVEGDELTITVPSERVDDFLKSLTVRDAKTGKSLPLSFPTMERSGDEVEMTIRLPQGSGRDLRVVYVTESPAWKPSYRVVLDDDGGGRLEAWAIVDNVSGEDWKKVVVGVGTTSALSFKYDLHSVRLVEREVLGGGPAYAAAPPTGGSPYQVASGEVQVLGNFRYDAVDALKAQRGAGGSADGRVVDEASRTVKRKRGVAFGATASRKPATEPEKASEETRMYGAYSAAADKPVRRLAHQLKNQGQRVRIEGFARQGESNAREASLDRANAIRDELIANGVPPEQVEAVGTGHYSSQNGVRLVAVADGETAGQKQQAKVAPAGSQEPIGSAYFVAATPMTIEKDHSAMISLLSTQVKATQVYYYDPVSTRGSKQFAFKAVKLENPSRYTLDSGPFTIYAKNQFLGEGLSEPIPAKSLAFVPFALDKKLLVETVEDTREEIDRLVTIERGIVTAESRRIRRTKLALANRGDKPALVYLRHAVPKGWKLRDAKKRFEKLRGAYLLPVTVPARGALEVEIEEGMPQMKTVDINTHAGVKAIGLYLRSSKSLDPELKKQLDDIVAMHRAIVDMQERIDTLNRQMAAYRTRVDEIHVQLVTLRKVTHAQKLSRHLAKRMEEISEKLQQATMSVTDLEGQMLAKKVTLQDRLAELSLDRKDDEAVAQNR